MKANGTKVAVVADGGGHAHTMFDAQDITLDGAFLAGALFLEVDEVFEVELSFDDSQTIRAKVRVERVEKGEKPGMAVSFAELSDSDRKLLASKLGA